MTEPVYPPPDERKSYTERIIEDFRRLELDFRANELDDSPWVRMDGEWTLMHKYIKAEIKMRLRNIGYSRRDNGKPSLTVAEDTWLALAHQQRYNPIKDFFDKLRQQDYEPQLDQAGNPQSYRIPEFTRFFTNPDELLPVWLFRWMCGAIAKLFWQERNPMLVLVSEQDMGKSSLVRWFCPVPDYFREAMIRPEIKDERIRLADTFMQEVPELGNSTRKADVEAVKDFVTRKFIVERLPYGDLPVKKPAITSFIGSVNPDGAGFLVDTTGNTRFLSCEIKSIDFKYSKYDCTALWREALWFVDNAYRPWELSSYEKKARDRINEKFQMVSALENVIDRHLIITGDPDDWLSSYDILETLRPWYRAANDEILTRQYSKILRSKGCDKRRSKYVPGQPHPWGWTGVKKPQV